jgi:alpha-beta hydrolase superfamily lysophospholipase
VKVMQDNPDALIEHDSFVGVRGLKIHARTWLPAGAPIGVVVIAHGFAEHGGRYAAVAERLVADGIAVRAADHRGHGLSEGRRTSIVRFGDYVDDLTTVIAQARGRWPSLRLVLLGHSMGGLVALDLAVRPGGPVDGLVLSAPAACPREVSRFTLAVGRALSRVAPNTGVLRLPLNRISRDPAVVDAYNNDPLVFRTPIRARLGAEMLDAMDRVDAGLPSLRTPLLVMQGTADGLVDPGCGPHVYDRAGSEDKTLKMYDGLWHEIFNEPERDHVLDDLTGWLRSHLG